MIIPREITSAIRMVLDTVIPPVIRDTYWFMYPFAWLAFGRHADTFLNFRKRVLKMTPQQYADVYTAVNPLFDRQTDLTQSCVKAIEQAIVGGRILEVGSGRGYLAKRLAKKYRVTACDLVIDPTLLREKHIRVKQGAIEQLPFPDRSFDTVICAHTLEHIIDFDRAVGELRRVTKKRLIIVVPMQRPFLYTLDLHVQFFPYPFSLISAMSEDKRKFHVVCRPIAGDLYYKEDR